MSYLVGYIWILPFSSAFNLLRYHISGDRLKIPLYTHERVTGKKHIKFYYCYKKKEKE